MFVPEWVEAETPTVRVHVMGDWGLVFHDRHDVVFNLDLCASSGGGKCEFY